MLQPMCGDAARFRETPGAALRRTSRSAGDEAVAPPKLALLIVGLTSGTRLGVYEVTTQIGEGCSRVSRMKRTLKYLGLGLLVVLLSIGGMLVWVFIGNGEIPDGQEIGGLARILKMDSLARGH